MEQCAYYAMGVPPTNRVRGVQPKLSFRQFVYVFFFRCV
jgi:hypothetical protein